MNHYITVIPTQDELLIPLSAYIPDSPNKEAINGVTIKLCNAQSTVLDTDIGIVKPSSARNNTDEPSTGQQILVAVDQSVSAKYAVNRKSQLLSICLCAE